MASFLTQRRAPILHGTDDSFSSGMRASLESKAYSPRALSSSPRFDTELQKSPHDSLRIGDPPRRPFFLPFPELFQEAPHSMQ
ncbi:hypothetical protein VNO77_27253 [Canavalia gladiata]|uniref:Uncharacterized protein n=1 Tax=Canavalia gladiata TaxID=3824 RepID=A0AAN9Q6A7_CANGL